MAETLGSNGGENEVGSQWGALTKEADAIRNNEGPGTDREASLRNQANALGAEADEARIKHLEEQADKIRESQGPGTDSEWNLRQQAKALREKAA
ncbi:hypothetical protein FWH13_01805 [Candidatus Saccharibacteria bacterium]|nr:hypothetical protein [Candidatus Saccharibacteria bacterium]